MQKISEMQHSVDNDERSETLCFRACRSSYIVLSFVCVSPVLAVVILGSVICGLRGLQRLGTAWPVVLLDLGVLVLIWMWLGSFEVTLGSGVVSYRSLFSRRRTISMDDVQRIHLQIGGESYGPFIAIIVEGRDERLVINAKVFQNDLLAILEEAWANWGQGELGSGELGSGRD